MKDRDGAVVFAREKNGKYIIKNPGNALTAAYEDGKEFSMEKWETL